MNLLIKHHTCTTALLYVVTLLSCSVTTADTGSSHNLFYLNKLNENSYFVSRANLVTRDGFSDTFFGYVDINYRYKISQPWSIEVGYRHAFLELSNGWREEYRPMLGVYWRDQLLDGKFSNRHRLEWRNFEGNAKDRTRYRNESVWISNSKLTEYQFSPFIEEEIFYDITDSEINTNWFTVGITKYWSRNIKWKLGYRLNSQKFNGDWSHRHMLVTGLSIFSFD